MRQCWAWLLLIVICCLDAKAEEASGPATTPTTANQEKVVAPTALPDLSQDKLFAEEDLFPSDDPKQQGAENVTPNYSTKFKNSRASSIDQIHALAKEVWQKYGPSPATSAALESESIFAIPPEIAVRGDRISLSDEYDYVIDVIAKIGLTTKVQRGSKMVDLVTKDDHFYYRSSKMTDYIVTAWEYIAFKLLEHPTWQSFISQARQSPHQVKLGPAEQRIAQRTLYWVYKQIIKFYLDDPAAGDPQLNQTYHSYDDITVLLFNSTRPSFIQGLFQKLAAEETKNSFYGTDIHQHLLHKYWTGRNRSLAKIYFWYAMLLLTQMPDEASYQNWIKVLDQYYPFWRNPDLTQSFPLMEKSHVNIGKLKRLWEDPKTQNMMDRYFYMSNGHKKIFLIIRFKYFLVFQPEAELHGLVLDFFDRWTRPTADYLRFPFVTSIEVKHDPSSKGLRLLEEILADIYAQGATIPFSEGFSIFKKLHDSFASLGHPSVHISMLNYYTPNVAQFYFDFMYLARRQKIISKNLKTVYVRGSLQLPPAWGQKVTFLEPNIFKMVNPQDPSDEITVELAYKIQDEGLWEFAAQTAGMSVAEYKKQHPRLTFPLTVNFPMAMLPTSESGDVHNMAAHRIIFSRPLKYPHHLNLRTNYNGEFVHPDFAVEKLDFRWLTKEQRLAVQDILEGKDKASKRARQMLFYAINDFLGPILADGTDFYLQATDVDLILAYATDKKKNIGFDPVAYRSFVEGFAEEEQATITKYQQRQAAIVRLQEEREAQRMAEEESRRQAALEARRQQDIAWAKLSPAEKLAVQIEQDPRQLRDLLTLLGINPASIEVAGASNASIITELPDLQTPAKIDTYCEKPLLGFAEIQRVLRQSIAELDFTQHPANLSSPLAKNIYEFLILQRLLINYQDHASFDEYLKGLTADPEQKIYDFWENFILTEANEAFINQLDGLKVLGSDIAHHLQDNLDRYPTFKDDLLKQEYLRLILAYEPPFKSQSLLPPQARQKIIAAYFAQRFWPTTNSENTSAMRWSNGQAALLLAAIQNTDQAKIQEVAEYELRAPGLEDDLAAQELLKRAMQNEDFKAFAKAIIKPDFDYAQSPLPLYPVNRGDPNGRTTVIRDWVVTIHEPNYKGVGPKKIKIVFFVHQGNPADQTRPQIIINQLNGHQGTAVNPYAAIMDDSMLTSIFKGKNSNQDITARFTLWLGQFLAGGMDALKNDFFSKFYRPQNIFRYDLTKGSGNAGYYRLVIDKIRRHKTLGQQELYLREIITHNGGYDHLRKNGTFSTVIEKITINPKNICGPTLVKAAAATGIKQILKIEKNNLQKVSFDKL